MLGLKATPLEASLPNHVRRRTWSHPELTSHSVLVLTFDRVYLAPLAGSPRPEMIAAIEAGGNLDALLGPLSTVIDLLAIQKLTLDLLTNSLIIDYAGSGVGRSRVRLTFATPEAADACFTKIWRRLGDGFQLAPHTRDSWNSVRAPLALLGLILALTAAFVGLQSIYQDRAALIPPPGLAATGDPAPALSPPRSGWDALLGWLNWKAVCGAGGVAAAASQVWLYRRLTTPPVALELVRA